MLLLWFAASLGVVVRLRKWRDSTRGWTMWWMKGGSLPPSLPPSLPSSLQPPPNILPPLKLDSFISINGPTSSPALALNFHHFTGGRCWNTQKPDTPESEQCIYAHSGGMDCTVAIFSKNKQIHTFSHNYFSSVDTKFQTKGQMRMGGHCRFMHLVTVMKNNRLESDLYQNKLILET